MQNSINQNFGFVVNCKKKFYSIYIEGRKMFLKNRLKLEIVSFNRKQRIHALFIYFNQHFID